MSDHIDNNTTYQRDNHQHSLQELLTIVRWWFDQLFGEFSFWCIGEIARLNVIKGRVYIDLIQFDDNHKVLAKAKAIMYDSWQREQFYTKTWLTESEMVGKKILFAGDMRFHQEYSFSITIRTLSHEYSLGQQKDHQQQIIRTLTKQWIIDNNHHIQRWMPPYTIAIVSSQWSQWATDFSSILEQSRYNNETILYETPIHGNEAKQWVHETLQQIYRDIQWWKNIDAVVIVRGGGGSSWIAWQNDLAIAQWVCHMPVPMIIAVGHTTDTSVLDQVAKHTAKTPTDAAYILIEQYDHYQQQVDALYRSIVHRTSNVWQQLRERLHVMYEGIHQQIRYTMSSLRERVAFHYESIQSINPHSLRNKWYGIVYDQDGNILSKEMLHQLIWWEKIRIDMYDMTIRVEVESLEKSESKD